MSGFLTFIFVLLIVWYGSKLFFKNVLPWLIIHFINKQQDKYQQGFEKPTQKKEGEIKIKVEKPDVSKTSDSGFGEYVDFEEVDPDEKPKNE